MMRRLGSMAILVAFSVTARGEVIQLTQPVVEALTPIDTVPDTDQLDSVFNHQTLDNLEAIARATGSTVDLGVQLRAIRTLPTYCPDIPAPCGVGTGTHDTLTQLIDRFVSDGAPTARDQLRLRAVIEALGVAGRSAGLQDDVDRLVHFLSHNSRDIRATTAKALGSLCNTQAIQPLRIRLQQENDVGGRPQVRLAISAALRDLGTGQCPH